MSLVGTLLLPCLALTRDLANAAAAFKVHSPGVVASRSAAVQSEAASSQPPVEIQGEKHSAGGTGRTSSPIENVGNVGTTAVGASPSPDVQQRQQQLPQQQQRQPSATVKAGTGLSRPALVTAVGFLSPYPLLMGTSTGGAVVLWRTSDCICVQARRKRGRSLPKRCLWSSLQILRPIYFSRQGGRSSCLRILSENLLLLDLKRSPPPSVKGRTSFSGDGDLSNGGQSSCLQSRPRVLAYSPPPPCLCRCAGHSPPRESRLSAKKTSRQQRPSSRGGHGRRRTESDVLGTRNVHHGGGGRYNLHTSSIDVPAVPC